MTGRTGKRSRRWMWVIRPSIRRSQVRGRGTRTWRGGGRKAFRMGAMFGGRAGVGGPPGVGTHVNWDERLDGLLAQSVMSVQAVKAVEIGRGVTAAQSLGSTVHDAIGYEGTGQFTEFSREHNNAGGLEGGISNGEDVV